MINKNYSCGIAAQSFWFIEMKKILRLHKSGMTEEQIKEICINNNILDADNSNRAKMIYSSVWKRINKLDKPMQKLFIESSVDIQKMINLISIMLCDNLFCEFVLEVYVEKNILGISSITNKDVGKFLSDKESQSDKIKNWSEGSKKRLCNTYINFLQEANFISKIKNEKNITFPILDEKLDKCLQNEKYYFIRKGIWRY